MTSEKRNDVCPKCHRKHGIQLSTFPSFEYLKYFLCPKCQTALALVREGKYIRLYQDDVKHMGFMTNGVGGY